jgi:hypothetical protein
LKLKTLTNIRGQWHSKGWLQSILLDKDPSNTQKLGSNWDNLVPWIVPTQWWILKHWGHAMWVIMLPLILTFYSTQHFLLTLYDSIMCSLSHIGMEKPTFRRRWSWTTCLARALTSSGSILDWGRTKKSNGVASGLDACCLSDDWLDFRSLNFLLM